jgi:hypothetical protein
MYLHLDHLSTHVRAHAQLNPAGTPVRIGPNAELPYLLPHA